MGAVRALPPSESVPYAFEKRIMTRLSNPKPADPWLIWGQALWRAAAPCIAIMGATMIWAVVSTQLTSPNDSMAVDLENAVLAPLTDWNETW